MKNRFWMKWIFPVCIILALAMAVYLALELTGGTRGLHVKFETGSLPTIERIVPAEKLKLICKDGNGNNKVDLEQETQLTLLSEPSNSDPIPTYTSSDPEIIQVDENGVVTGKALGKATITAEAQDGSGLTEEIELTVRVAQPQNLRVLCSTGGDAFAHLYWSEVEEATGYMVYRQLNGGQWLPLTDEPIQKTSFTDTETVADGDHAYAVEACAEEEAYNSARSSSVMMSLPETPYGLKISDITDDGIEVYWKRPAGAKGYEVFRFDDETDEYKMIADIDTRSIYTYVDDEFDHSNEEVYYKVRSYSLDDNDRKVYSKISESVTARYRTKTKLERSEIFLRSGKSRTLAAYQGWGTADNLRWTSSDPDIATVSSKHGKITAIRQGSCTITCLNRDTGEKRRCTVTVDREPLDALKKITSDFRQNSNGVWVNDDAPDSGDAVIMMTGDMMCTGTQQAVQGYDTGDYNFNDSFAGVRELISGADFAIGNLETTLSSTWPYMHEEAYIDNYANCNAPSRYLDAVKYAGFDAVVMSNNHNCDAGIQGAQETLEQVERYKLAHTGMFHGGEDQRYLLVDVNGIKVGYLSYTTEEVGFNDKSDEWTEEDIETYLNLYSRDKAEREVQELRDAGAEYVIVYMHWGIKNVQEATEDQQNTAQELADLGTDYIVGSHCHLVQKYTTITASDGREVPCFYSLGDFQSSISQVSGNRDSAILRIRLERDSDGTVVLRENQYIPCYTLTSYWDMPYYTIPIDSSLNGGTTLSHYEKTHARIAAAVGSEISEYTGDEE
ncbi:MAG: CapA family protein [Butyricicoccus sp.]